MTKRKILNENIDLNEYMKEVILENESEDVEIFYYLKYIIERKYRIWLKKPKKTQLPYSPQVHIETIPQYTYTDIRIKMSGMNGTVSIGQLLRKLDSYFDAAKEFTILVPDSCKE